MQLRPSLFWDFDIAQIDLLKHQASVIERITLRGRFDEFIEMIGFYGKENAKKSLLNARYLDKRTLSYCVVFFETPITEFRCYKLAQSNPEHWDY
jgi:hypothetical protein